MIANKKMHIKKICIENFKCFKGRFTLELNEGLNIIVGNNEAGKSTILEAIHLALTGILNGRYLRNELTQYFFNLEVTREYLNSLKQGNMPLPPPYILIELFIAGEDLPFFEGDGNSEKKKECCITMKICFDESKYKPEYEALIKSGNVNTIPIEYYEVFWRSCARDNITSRSIPLKSAFIDSSSSRYQNGSDIYISRIIKEFLDHSEIIDISQAHRKMKDAFMQDESIKKINAKIKSTTKISHKNVKLSVDLSTRHAWEDSLMTFLDDVPFHYIGKGEQCIIKTKLALSHKKSQEANIILLEEPENHLSHTKLNGLIFEIKNHCEGKQIIITTHSSFVANKLGLNYLLLLNDRRPIKLKDLKMETWQFFEKLPGYDTLRLILCERAILVEGDSDELVVQKAYLQKYNKLPIEDEIDVISVGMTFLRFLEIAVKINKTVSVVTDNDGDIVALEEKYSEYIGTNKKDFIKICYDSEIDKGSLKIGKSDYNYNTLESKLLKVNNLNILNKIFGTNHENEDLLRIYMYNNKTSCALKLFNTTDSIDFPSYIIDALQ